MEVIFIPKKRSTFLFIVLSSIAVKTALATSSSTSECKHVNSSSNSTAGLNCSDSLNSSDAGRHEHVSVHVARFDFESVRDPYAILLVVLVTSIVKLVFHSSEKVSSHVPESCLLIAFGFILGALISLSPAAKQHFKFTPNIFFHYLLPPIVLEAGYLMHKRYFFSNLGSILMYAVVGTLWNTFSVALCLYMVSEVGGVSIGTDLTFVDCMLMGTIVAAVDPVAVLAIFDEVHVNLLLYILVFGESLLNDAVSVVLYRTAETFVKLENNQQEIDGEQIGLAIISFFTISLGGTLIGILWGMVASFVTRFTDEVRVIETLIVFVCGYLAYLSAEIFHFSGIMSAISCGVVMRHYLNPNVSGKSRTTIKYCMKMLSSASETVVFMFLGFASVTATFQWDTGLVLGTLAFALIFRFVGVFGLTAILNKVRSKKISYVDQFIMGYGGLRGAVSFSLVLLLDEEVVPGKDAMFTALFTLIMFTVFIQGTTVKPLVHWLHVQTYQPTKPSLNEQLHSKMMDHIGAGIEDIIGEHGEYWFTEMFQYYDNKYIKPVLSRSDKEIIDTVLQRLEKKYHCDTTHRHLDEVRHRRESQDLLSRREGMQPPACSLPGTMPTLPSALSPTTTLNKDNVQVSVGDIFAPSKQHPMHSMGRNNVDDQFDVVRLRLLRLRYMQDVERSRRYREAAAVQAEAACMRRASSDDNMAHTAGLERRRSDWSRRRAYSECRSDQYHELQENGDDEVQGETDAGRSLSFPDQPHNSLRTPSPALTLSPARTSSLSSPMRHRQRWSSSEIPRVRFRDSGSAALTREISFESSV